MLALAPLLPPPAPPLAAMAWTSEWRITREGKAVGTARESWHLDASGSGTTRFTQMLDAGDGTGKRVAERAATLGPGGVTTQEDLTLTTSTAKVRYVAELRPKMAAMKVTMTGFRATYEIDAPAGVARGTLIPATVGRLIRSKGTMDLTVFEPQNTRWARFRVTVGKQMGKDVLVRLQERPGVYSDYAYDPSFRPRVIQFSTGYRFERTALREGA